MSAASSLFDLLEEIPRQIVQVLVPLPPWRLYDYTNNTTETLSVGDFVQISLRNRLTVGVVWGESAASVSTARLKNILKKYQVPPLPLTHRQFIEKIAGYTLSDLGSVLKLSLSVPSLFRDTLQKQYEYRLLKTPDRLSPQQEKIVRHLQDGKFYTAAEIAKVTEVGRSSLITLVKAGSVEKVDVTPPPLGHIVDILLSSIPFSQEQEKAIEHLVGLIRQHNFSATLLDGLTASGKTEVYFEAIAEALRQKKQILILLPEISLSTQFITRFKKRFGAAPALWHSDISEAERKKIWLAVARGETNVVVGARSSLFLPYSHLGLIIVDEEHDPSYKQEESVIYHARDMAVLRANLERCPVVLVSATPSLETLQNVKEGKYTYCHLPSRHSGIQLPEIHLIDLRKENTGRQQFLSSRLKQAIKDNLLQGQQSLLFLNRRGYAPLTLCRACGYRFQCPACSAWLVTHKISYQLLCHHCGYHLPIPHTCPQCAEEDQLIACGPGVERIEEEVRLTFPEARTLMLTSDLAESAKLLSDAIQKIEAKEVDIIIGTQMVSKGHHFPELTLVGVIDADLGLAGGDPRASERTFQILQQVAGRAGRGNKSGQVFLQTYMPDQNVIRALAANQRDAFLKAELNERAITGLPPFGRLAALILSSERSDLLDAFCLLLAQKAPRYDDIRVLGPAIAPLAMLRHQHRRRFLIKTGKNIFLQRYLQEWLSLVKIPKDIHLKIDIDPQSFF